LAFRLTGSIDVVYLLGPLTIIACLAGVWLLARAVVGPIEALFARWRSKASISTISRP